MIHLRTFGAVDLRRDGIEVRSVLNQPKRLALLAYLVARGAEPSSRESLCSIFWPDSDDDRARNSLRQATHFLRKSLGAHLVQAADDGSVLIDATAFDCDLIRFRAALAAADFETAQALFRGDFLAGLSLDADPVLDRWVEDTRTALRIQAAGAAVALERAADQRGDIVAALGWLRRHLEIEPLDEGLAARLMRRLAEQGEVAAALRVHQEIRDRLRVELDSEPDAELTRLAAELSEGARSAPTAVADSMPATGRPSVRASKPPSEPTSLPSAEPTQATPVEGASGQAHNVPDPGVGEAGTTRSAATPSPPLSRRGSGSRWRRSGRQAAAALGVPLLVAGVVWLTRPGPPHPEEEPPSVAVLPFVDMTADRGSEYFADGVAEELLNLLAGLPGLRVAARTSSFSFRDRALTTDSIGRLLGVNHIVEGSIRTAGNQVRITAQLIDVGGGFHVWSETFEGDLDDIFTTQDRIAIAIARALQLELAGDFWGVTRTETATPEAHRLLLRALHVFRVPSPDAYALAVSLTEDALRLDPNYPRAHGVLANLLLWQAATGLVPAEAARERADSLARRGLRLGETPESHLALGRLAEVMAHNPGAADRHYQRALELNPSDVRTLNLRAQFLARNGSGQEAVAAARRSTELDPLHPGSWSTLGSVLSMLGREEEALAVFERARTVAPGDIITVANLAAQYANTGRLDSAVQTADEALRIDPGNHFVQGLRIHLLFQLGRTAEAIAGLQRLEADPAFPRFRLALLWASTDQIDHTLDLLDEAVASREDEVVRLRSPDIFVGMREHPRFQSILARLDGQDREPSAFN